MLILPTNHIGEEGKYDRIEDRYIDIVNQETTPSSNIAKYRWQRSTDSTDMGVERRVSLHRSVYTNVDPVNHICYDAGVDWEVTQVQ